MSVLLIGSSLVTTLLIPPEEFAKGGEANGRALAYLAHEHFGELFGTRLRPQHDLDPVVRRRVGDGRAAQPGAPLPAALRHGAGVGARHAPAGAGLHRHHLRRDHRLRGRRGRAGRRLRHRRAGADDLGRRGGHARPSGGPRRRWAPYLRHHARLRLHDGRRTSSSGRKASRSRPSSSPTIIVTSLVSRVLRSTELRIQRRRDSTRTRRRSSIEARAAGQSASSPTGRASGDVAEYAAKEREARDDHSLDDGEPVLFLEVRPRRRLRLHRRARGPRRARSGRYRVLRCESPAVPNAIAGAAAPHPRHDRQQCRTPTSGGPKATRSRTC